MLVEPELSYKEQTRLKMCIVPHHGPFRICAAPPLISILESPFACRCSWQCLLLACPKRLMRTPLSCGASRDWDYCEYLPKASQLSIFLVNTSIISSLSQTYVVDISELYGAITLLRTLLRGTFLPLVAPCLYAKVGLGWINSVLAFITVALIPLPFFLYWCGGWRR